MTNSKQAGKRVRQNELARDRNKATRSSMRTAMKRVLKAESPDVAQKAVPQAMKQIDKAAKHNVIHKNAAARLKGQVARAASK